MAMPQHSQKAIDDFFATIEPLAAAYCNPSFSFVAVRHEARLTLVQGFLHLLAPSGLPFSSFRSETVVAAHYLINDISVSARQFVESLLSGEFASPHGNIEFRPSHAGGYVVYHIPFHSVALQNQSRMDVLRITGAEQNRHMRQPDIDWELRSITTPYDGIQELMFEYRLGGLHQDFSSVEVLASGVAAVDVASAVLGEKADLRVRLLKRLSRDEFALGYRVLAEARVVERNRLRGRDFEWREGLEVQEGGAEVPVPQGALLQCFAAYRGIVQHFYWVAGRSSTQNPRRAAYEAFDPNLTTLRSLIPTGSSRGREARELESAVSWILWMLGFSVMHLGGTTKLQEASDVLVTTPAGHVAVIECTTGLLKAENKLASLHERAMAVRRALDTGGGSASSSDKGHCDVEAPRRR